MSEQIKETDIMIGNFFHVGSDIGRVLIINGQREVKFDNVYLECSESFEWFEINSLKGIPLTEDILLKCGFEKRNTDQIRYNRETIELTHVEFWDEDDDGNEVSFKEWKLSELYHSDLFYYKSFPSIQYLHQLQNLFKALTQTDLKVEV